MILPANPSNWQKWRSGPAWQWRFPPTYYDERVGTWLSYPRDWPAIWDLVTVGAFVPAPGKRWHNMHRWLCFQNRLSGLCVWVPSNEAYIDATDYAKFPIPSRFLYD